jgi:hypothetical protein
LRVSARQFQVAGPETTLSQIVPGSQFQYWVLCASRQDHLPFSHFPRLGQPHLFEVELAKLEKRGQHLLGVPDALA